MTATLREIFRYPIKSLMGEALETVSIGRHGLIGDRRLALRRLGDHGSFPWLTASKYPDLIRYQPVRHDDIGADALPSHVQVPSGNVYPAFDEGLAWAIQEASGHRVEMMQMKTGIFDDAVLSLIFGSTADAIAVASQTVSDVRRFRPNLVVDDASALPFTEEQWIGREVIIGSADTGVRLYITERDPRCVMVSLDPDTAVSSPEVLKSVVRDNAGCAGVYGVVLQSGAVQRGDTIRVV